MTEDNVMETALTLKLTHQGVVVLKRNSFEDFIQENFSDGTLAWVRMDGDWRQHVVNVISDRIGSRDLSSIVMHEVGHVLGIEDHCPFSGALMTPNYSQGSACIDRETARAVAYVHRGWDWRHMNWCRGPED
jgi:hypothetical protein